MMERTWFIIVDQDGEEIRTSNVREAKTAFSCGGIVTMVREQDMDVDDILVRTSLFIDVKSSKQLKN